eukprot:gene17779-biopygen836
MTTAKNATKSAYAVTCARSSPWGGGGRAVVHRPGRSRPPRKTAPARARAQHTAARARTRAQRTRAHRTRARGQTHVRTAHTSRSAVLSERAAAASLRGRQQRRQLAPPLHP